MAAHSRVVCTLISVSLWSISGDRLAVKYRILEEQRPHTIIGNVAADARLNALYSVDELIDLRYHLVAVIWNRPLRDDDEKLTHFTLDANTGQLTTSRAVLFYFGKSLT